jgi:hypothetical protein
MGGGKVVHNTYITINIFCNSTHTVLATFYCKISHKVKVTSNYAMYENNKIISDFFLIGNTFLRYILFYACIYMYLRGILFFFAYFIIACHTNDNILTHGQILKYQGFRNQKLINKIDILFKQRIDHVSCQSYFQ